MCICYKLIFVQKKKIHSRPWCFNGFMCTEGKLNCVHNCRKQTLWVAHETPNAIRCLLEWRRRHSERSVACAAAVFWLRVSEWGVESVLFTKPNLWWWKTNIAQISIPWVLYLSKSSVMESSFWYFVVSVKLRVLFLSTSVFERGTHAGLLLRDCSHSHSVNCVSLF